jgi:hypothetical protein
METKKMPIWPEYEVTETVAKDPKGYTEVLIRVATYIRKQHEGIWYLIPVVDHFTASAEHYTESNKQKFFKRFSVNVYNAIIPYIIDINCRNVYNEPVNIVDEDQSSEEDRLKKRYVWL